MGRGRRTQHPRVNGSDALIEGRARARRRPRDDYAKLLSSSTVGTLAVGTVLGAYNWPEKSERYERIAAGSGCRAGGSRLSTVRFRSSKQVGACFGLTTRKYQSGETDRSGSISRAGDASVRVALFEAAHVIMTRVAAWSKLKAWAMNVAKRRGAKRAKVAPRPQAGGRPSPDVGR